MITQHQCYWKLTQRNRVIDSLRNTIKRRNETINTLTIENNRLKVRQVLK